MNKIIHIVFLFNILFATQNIVVAELFTATW